MLLIPLWSFSSDILAALAICHHSCNNTNDLPNNLKEIVSENREYGVRGRAVYKQLSSAVMESQGHMKLGWKPGQAVEVYQDGAE